MADPILLTGIVGTAAAVVGAATPILFERRKGRKDREADAEKASSANIESWAELNKALNREIARLHSDVDRIRSDYETAIARQQREHEAEMQRQRADYEARLEADHRRITELETDVASLKRILGQGLDGPGQGQGRGQ